MSNWKGAIVILLFLLYSLQVYSVRPTITSKAIKLRRKQLITGKNNIDESALLYALCKINGETAKCRVYLKFDVFDNTEYSCEATASSQLGKLHLLGVELWGADKALFVWRDINTNNGRGELYIEALHMRDCFSKVNQFSINIRNDNKQQEYIITSEFNYNVTFLNYRDCINDLCKVSVDMRGHATHPQPWIPRENLILALESIEYSPKNLLICIAEHNGYVAELYLVNGETTAFLTSFYDPSVIGWSSSNGIISFCHRRECKRYNLAAQLQSETTLKTQPTPIEYVALYNMPDGGHLALVCFHEQNSVYRILQIKYDGKEGYTYDLNDLVCNHKFSHMAGKFYEKSSGEFCLSLFYAKNGDAANFVSYCLPPSILYQD